ncbi:MAG TPA: MFS transporter [Stellaceae bacterium]|jgi:AAHS family 4-hydroxybenzoate transporter-like MFS transporter
MAEPATVDVAEVLETRKVGAFQLGIWALAFLMLFMDGFDLSGALVGAPALLRTFHAQRSQLGLVFGLSGFGALAGTYLYGYVIDWYGRRAAALSAVLIYSLSAIACGFITSLDQLLWPRLIAGLGFGGIMPTAIAYIVEMAPKRHRVTFTMIGTLGLTLGISAMGQVGAWLLPLWGWQVVFFLPGATGLALALLLWLALPESLRYLALKQPQSPVLRQKMKQLAPELAIGPETRFVLPPQPPISGLGLKRLFQGPQRIASPLLWAGYLVQTITFAAVTNWYAVLLESLKLSPLQASLTFSYGALAGAPAHIATAWLFDRIGPYAVVVALLIATAAMAVLGLSGISPLTIMITGVVCYAFCQACQGSFNGMVGVFYPTNIRGKGIGYASGMGRVGMIIGPMVTGFLLSGAFSVGTTLYIVAAPYLVTAIICGALGMIYWRKFAGGEAAAAGVAATLPPQPVGAAAVKLPA